MGWSVGRRASCCVLGVCAWLLPVAGPLAALEAPSPERYEIAPQEAWIPMPDGVRLAADLYMPSGGGSQERFPVLLEYLPYRKTEARRRNHELYSYFIHRGYVVARVDIRGTGNSEGGRLVREKAWQDMIPRDYQ